MGGTAWHSSPCSSPYHGQASELACSGCGHRHRMEASAIERALAFVALACIEHKEDEEGTVETSWRF